MSQNNFNVPEMTGGEFQERMNQALDRWQNVSAIDVQQSMPNAQVVNLGERTVGLVVVEPETSDYDEETAITLGLPHKNGWTPQHSIRAKILQQTVAPDSRVIVFPDNSFGSRLSQYTKDDKRRMKEGDSLPIAEAQMAALEALAPDLGIKRVSSTGYSKGGRPALGLAAVGSDVIEIEKVNADETPSEEGRGLVKLGIDFMLAGTDVEAASKAAGIPALSEIMSSGELRMDFLKFALANIDPRSLNDIRSMTGSVEPLVARAIQQIGGENVKLGGILDGKMFVPGSMSEESQDQVRIEQYYSPGTFGHATGDNVVLHAAMAYRGLALHH